MRTLLITSSYDATSDLLITELGTEKFIRLNLDRPRDWAIALTPEQLCISSTHGAFKDEDISKCIWRKPFMSKPQDDSFSDDFVGQEWKYTLYEIALLMQDKGKLRMNFPIADYELGKLKQQRYAHQFFKTSASVVYVNSKPITKSPSIAKSLSGSVLSGGKVLYTVDVTQKALTKDVWYIQDRIDAKFDLTVVYLYGEVFTFRLDRSKLSSLDWRKDQFEIAQDWEMISLGCAFNKRIKEFMEKLDLVYGRLDFLQPDIDAEPIFLEVNKNGQWAWLDANKDNGLFRAMCKITDPLEV